ncbi:hypothetical protein LCGC14_0517770 [marine sediment metagenome]|uniref:Uncharacterized protein n=1 Tax=marine sediment metagenome TaxID=412755 RepID=A0A0F9RZG7_9ZZZZ|nr:hypothetical protein [bacterium]
MPEDSFYSKDSFEFHEYADIFPLMNSKQFERLTKSLEAFGQQEDIVLLNQKILDGRNTYLSCKQANITPRFKKYDSKLDPLDYVRIKNLDRRHMNSAQLAEVALRFVSIERENALERQTRTQFGAQKKIKPDDAVGHPGLPTGKSSQKGKSFNIVAKDFNMAPKTLRKADKIKKIAEKDPEIQRLWEKALTGEIPLEDVYRRVKDKFCCFNCSHAKANTCIGCAKKCLTLQCEQGLDIKFKKYCKEFDY